MSDHSANYLKINFNNRRKNTLWRLSEGILNNKGLVEEVKMVISTKKKMIMGK